MDIHSIQTYVAPWTGLDFGLDGDIPRYWLDGHPFKTRFVDALSMTFPIGEPFFISSVRRYRDQITDPEQLAADVFRQIICSNEPMRAGIAQPSDFLSVRIVARQHPSPHPSSNGVHSRPLIRISAVHR